MPRRIKHSVKRIDPTTLNISSTTLPAKQSSPDFARYCLLLHFAKQWHQAGWISENELLRIEKRLAAKFKISAIPILRDRELVMERDLL